jgi:hypothetical protein
MIACGKHNVYVETPTNLAASTIPLAKTGQTGQLYKEENESSQLQYIVLTKQFFLISEKKSALQKFVKDIHAQNLHLLKNGKSVSYFWKPKNSSDCCTLFMAM